MTLWLSLGCRIGGIILQAWNQCPHTDERLTRELFSSSKQTHATPSLSTCWIPIRSLGGIVVYLKLRSSVSNSIQGPVTTWNVNLARGALSPVELCCQTLVGELEIAVHIPHQSHQTWRQRRLSSCFIGRLRTICHSANPLSDSTLLSKGPSA